MSELSSPTAVLKLQLEEGFSLPYLPVAVLIDVMEAEGLVVNSAPSDKGALIRWFDPFEGSSTCPVGVDPGMVLHHLTVARAREYFKGDGAGFVIVDSTKGELPMELVPFQERLFLVTESAAGVDVGAVIQLVFMQMGAWENQLVSMAKSKAPEETALNMGAALFNNFIFIVGVDHNLIAASTAVEPPNETYARMVSDRSLSSGDFSQLITSLRVTRRSAEITAAKDDSGLPCLVYPLQFRTSYFASLVMVCTCKEPSLGILMMFQHFAHRVFDLVSTHWEKDVGAALPHYFFLTSLLRGDTFSRETVLSNLKRLGIPLRAQYKVVVLDFNDCALKSADVMLDAMSHLNGGMNYCVMYEDYVVCVIYAERGGDATISHKKTLADLQAYVYGPFGAVCGYSQVFEHITDVHLAYKQAVYVLRNRDAIQTEMTVVDGFPQRPGLSFETMFMYFLISGDNIDKEFLKFSFSHTILDKIANEDLANGTCDFALLWYFLAYERNASKVGRRLFMHRNSVLYHIKQIEKRFDFELSDQFLREKLILEYRIHFLKLGDEVLAKLFSPAEGKALPPEAGEEE